MIWQTIKKQALILIRNRQHLFLLIGLPIILISILSLALGGFMSGEVKEINIKVAITESKEQQQIDKFINELHQRDLLEEEKGEMIYGAQENRVIALLTEEIFPAFQGQIDLKIIDAEEIPKKVKDNSYTAIIEVPDTFTYDLLNYMYFNEGEQPALSVSINEEKQLGSQIIVHILEEFEKQMAFYTFAAKEGVNVVELHEGNIEIDSSIKSISRDLKPIEAKDYYTIAMAVMNVLFIASTIGAYAYLEKRTHVFNRIIISNVSHWKYFFGIYISSVIFAFLQLMIIFSAAKLIFNINLENILGVAFVSFALSCAVGGLAVLLTAISYRMDSEVLTNYFQSIIVSIFAFVGGSFFPIGNFSKFFHTLGNLTPNGSGLSAYLLVLRGSPVTSTAVMEHIYYLLGFSLVLIIVAVLSFPKRGQMI